MRRLSGKTILIGREAKGGRLSIVLLSQGQQKEALLGDPSSVPLSVSHCQPERQTAHCKIEIDQRGSMTITNLKAGNATYVDGKEVRQKRLTDSSAVALGPDRYALDLSLVVHTAIRLAEAMTPRLPYSIAHLEQVWSDYEAALDRIQRRQQTMGRRRLLPIIISSAYALLSALLALVNIHTLWFSIPVLVVVIVAYLLIYYQRDTSIEDRKRALDTLIDNYVCPNPDCRHFMGSQPYKVLRQTKKCPYCGCPFKA
ncbi:MAG: FHA domain-containing protein [Prevotellaceae bacterium]|nr:FHA domain-containing protein [Prevotellaceae bacterium]